MPTKSATDADIPVGSDPYALTADLKKLSESTKSVIPITNTAELTALPGLFPGGVLPDGTLIRREDMDGQLLSWSATKGAWRPTGPKVNAGPGARIGDITGVQAGFVNGSITPIFYATSVVVTTDASGYFSHDLAVPMPNGILTTIYGNGDTAVNRQIIFGIATAPFTNTKSRIFGSAVVSGAAYTNATIRVEIIAIGW